MTATISPMLRLFHEGAKTCQPDGLIGGRTGIPNDEIERYAADVPSPPPPSFPSHVGTAANRQAAGRQPGQVSGLDRLRRLKATNVTQRHGLSRPHYLPVGVVLIAGMLFVSLTQRTAPVQRDQRATFSIRHSQKPIGIVPVGLVV